MTSEIIVTALGNLAARKLRTALTMLGMVFGVGAVIAMLSIGAGGEQKALESIGRLGLQNVLVKAKEVKPEDRQELRKKSLGVSLRDGEAIAEAVPNVERVLPRVEVKAYKSLATGGKAKGKVLGLSADYAAVADVPIAEGRFFDKRDQAEHAQVAVVGPTIRRDLFGYGPAIGRQVKINAVWVEVIGILRGDGTDKEIWIPVSTAMRKFDRDPLDAPVDELVVKVKDGVSTGATAELIRPLLDRLHGGADDYDIVIPEALLEQRRQTQRIFNIVMGSIAGISLLVGGIGIMNIMLASVMERTREIGVRRAIGAKQKNIVQQFLIEAISISVTGGLIGVFLGVSTALSISFFSDTKTLLTLYSILIAFFFSVLVGVGFGIFPAKRAAQLDPIESIRYE